MVEQRRGHSLVGLGSGKVHRVSGEVAQGYELIDDKLRTGVDVGLWGVIGKDMCKFVRMLRGLLKVDCSRL